MINAAVMVPMTVDEDLESLVARKDNGESLTASQEDQVSIYRMWSRTIDIVSGSIPGLQVQEATPSAHEDHYSVVFQGKEISITDTR